MCETSGDTRWIAASSEISLQEVRQVVDWSSEDCSNLILLRSCPKEP